MEIVHIVSCLTTGGAEKLVADMAIILKKKNINVKVISLLDLKGVPYQILKENNIEVIELRYNNKFNIKIAYDIYKYTRKADIVHTHTYYAQVYSTFFVNRKKLFTTEHNTYNKRRKFRIFKILDYFMYKKYNKIICISGATKESLNKWIKSTKSKSLVINNGIEIDKYYFAKQEEREIFEANKNMFILSCVASLTEQKNHMMLIEEMKYVDKNIKLAIIGEGDQREKLIKRVKELKLEKQIIFLGNQRNIAGLMKASDALILVSKWEGFGLVAIEGAATETTLILSDVPGLNSLFEANDVYMVNENSSVSDIINKVYYTAKDERRKVPKHKLNKYSIEIMVNSYLNIYCKNNEKELI